MPRVARMFRAVRDQLQFQFAKTHRIDGGALLVGGDSVADPAFERDERKIVAEALKETEVFIDVGANVGLYTVMARAAGVQVMAIEPHPVNLRYLRRNLAKNGWSDVEICAAGVGRERGEAPLYGGSTGASLVPGWAEATTAQRRHIEITTLDALLAHRFEGRRLFFKIDIEGFEYDALCGATDVLRRTPRPKWLVEITLFENRKERNARFADTFALFFDAGYRALQANASATEVTQADVRAWFERGRVPDEARNFLFV